MTDTNSSADAVDTTHGDTDDPRTSFRVDTLPRSLPNAFGDYFVRLRGGDPGGLPAVLGLVVIGALFTFTSPLFLTSTNIGNLMSQASYISIIALGLVFVLILGEIDLSAGAAGGVAAGFAAQALRSQDLQHGVGRGVFYALLIGMIACAGLAVWKKLYIPAGLIVLGAVVVVAGLEEKHVWLAFYVAVAIGLAIGVLNGVLVTALGIPSFIVTLALFLAWEGVTLDSVKNGSIGITNYYPWFALTQQNMPAWASWLGFAAIIGGYAAITLTRTFRRKAAGVSYDELALVLARVAVLAVGGGYVVWWLNQKRGSVSGVPWAASIPIAFMIAFTLLLTRTTWGRHLFAIGGNAEAARRAGIPVDRVKISAFMVCSAMAAIGGLFLASYVGGAQRDLGQGNTLLYSVAAAVIGGTSLFGGRGKARDAIIGAIVIAMIPNGIQLHSGLPISVVQEITGVVLLIAASVDAISRRRSRAG
jgi:D-xylose transport system permease protein